MTAMQAAGEAKIEPLYSSGDIQQRIDELANRARDLFRDVDELHACAIQNRLGIDVLNVAVCHTALDDDGEAAEREPELVEGVELERKRGLDLRPSAAQLFDVDRLLNGGSAGELAEDLDALGVTPGVGHASGL